MGDEVPIRGFDRAAAPHTKRLQKGLLVGSVGYITPNPSSSYPTSADAQQDGTPSHHHRHIILETVTLSPDFTIEALPKPVTRDLLIMELHLYLLPAGAALFLLVLQQIISSIIFWRKYKFPNPVPGIPIFGNTFQMPLLQQGVWAKKKAEQYGEMFTMKIGANMWVFLNSSRTVNDLLEKRSAITASRPRFPFTNEIMSGGSRVVLMPYSEKWKSVRKYMHQILSARQKDTFRPYQDLESKHLLWDYLHNTDKWFTANARFANSVIMTVVFGRRSDLDNPDMAQLFRTAEMFLENQQPGKNLVDAFPILASLPKPLQWWRPRAQWIHNYTVDCYKKFMAELDRRLKDGTQKPCFAVDFLKIAEKEKFDEITKLFTMGSLMEAGSDTSRVSIGQIIAGAATYPDWVERARKELDEVCGANAERLPGWDDFTRLPYIMAVVKEGFRWRPNIAEIGAPHMLTQDTEYEGYRFPKGTIFTWNAWAIALSEKEYQEPERFWPERFLNDDLYSGLKGHWAFGPGRRVCTGWTVGEGNVWIAIARLLYCFDFKQDPAHPIDTMKIPQITRGQAPYHVNITVRSPKHAALIDRECIDAVNTKY
ncbi:hypothetical protein LTR99_010644 [Exophiala xenobiotica]|uniref:Cytochrome P450 n=1 Tax=Vermiconidia calcicola TaxID=1690605 RepID=A0AAV9Q4F3_9PEZI|nr:hypothetical protein LTR96_001882 [Exophiala xenobiotica]KAK5533855.1 hypothetical protein LTR25_006835 [Vermiconidia calcicola]KAK5546406.1 hypothetical protein LTR23_003511 [Chaetothyriales sp. CCFEE 6169]KAK5291791.1 hypothetical protein LTR99_010644 [Exophiala xenobiotica]KAK5342065.1 hypothetical protein LTR98_002859 [Exophiala xenobiotica]